MSTQGNSLTIIIQIDFMFSFEGQTERHMTLTHTQSHTHMFPADKQTLHPNASVQATLSFLSSIKQSLTSRKRNTVT